MAPRRGGVRTPRRGWLWLAAIAGAVALAGGAYALRMSRALPQTCRTAIVTRGSIRGVLQASSRLAVTKTVRVGSTLPGQVVEVNAAVGDHVTRGQVLARLDDVEQRAAVAGADAQAVTAELAHARAQRELRAQLQSLQDQGALPRLDAGELLDGDAGDAQLDYMQAGAQVAKHRRLLQLARERLSRRTIRAPMTGVVVWRSIEPGESIAATPPGAPLFVIGSEPDRLQMTVALDARYSGSVKPGPVSFTVSGQPQRSFTAMVREVAPSITPEQSPATVVVLMDVANADRALTPGMAATVDFPMESPKDALQVPAAAITSRGDHAGPSVWLDDGGGHAALAPVRVGVMDADVVEVQGVGVAAGRVVILSGHGAPACVVQVPESPLASHAW